MRSLASFLDILLSSPETPSDDQEHHGDNLDRIKRQRVREDGQGASTRQLDRDQSLEVLNKKTCGHPGYIREMCVACGRKVDHGTCLAKYHPLKYIFEDLIARLRNKESLRDKKLHLVLDLDTLLNSTLLKDVTPGKLFDMYIYTMGECSYALEMARLLEPGEKYFGSKVIAREDCTRSHQKGLDAVLGKESAVLILDDTEEVWAKHKENVIVMETYNFFASSHRQSGFDRKSLSELESDERANLTDGDVREVLKKYRKSCLTRPAESLTQPRKNRLSRGY
ncbi:hypothetical protein RHSIM_Rhsim11G0073300 [Rhododendron simsii]|uniref:protein-serine/threonine phosphatase n=1 Tax=Rhododendron simsii TaxID=118357 RepID=A0A834GE85_RHOSS|nr:hypothetical protein RHSIM_Rhsim11G0073300 [Rhododendron simsii]